jgi:tetratricopeptide (TPR) repeat protein
MRAYAGVAEVAWQLGDRARAIAIYKDMLRLNPNDNQGVRYQLAIALLEERTSKSQAELAALLDRYRDDVTAHWAYSRTLLLYQQQGKANDKANWALAKALEANPHVPPLMLGERAVPRELPEYRGFGDVNEAVEYVASAFEAWRQTSGALFWLRQQRQR